MVKQKKNCHLGLLLFFLSLGSVHAQEIYLSGVVRDSSTYQVLSYVNIQHNTGRVIASSDSHGFFSLTAHKGDTLVFTRLGYTPSLFVPEQNEWDLNIKLAETSKMLQNVTIYDKFEIHGQQQIQKSIKEGAKLESSPFQNPTAKPGNNYTVQTFGPGLVISGPFSRFSKEEIEKRKLREVYLEQQRTSVYRDVIRSEQVKQYLTKTFSVSEEFYFKKLETFAIKYPGAENLRTRKEVVDMLVVFFAAKD
jgi:CarboxypepD_reg-like domain